MVELIQDFLCAMYIPSEDNGRLRHSETSNYVSNGGDVGYKEL